MRTGKKKLAAFVVLAVSLVLGCDGVGAQDSYPSKPIKLMMSFAAGGPTDTVARIMGAKMAELLGQPIVVENRTGAGATSAPTSSRRRRLTEQGVSGFECYTWNAILAPARTPTHIVAQLSGAINKALADPTVFKRLQDAGVDPTPGGTPQKLSDFIKAELAKWAPIIKASGASVD